MMTVEEFDGIVIGAGQGGGPLASALGRDGWTVTMIEREHAGGTCINDGCTPTKTWAASARAAYMARRSSDLGVHTGDVTVDMEKVLQRKDDIVSSWRESSRKRIAETDGVEYIGGEARFLDQNAVEVALDDGGARRLRARRGIFIDTGQRPRVPALEGLNDVPYLTNTSILELTEVPDHLVILGGGYLGLEFGQMFRRFGADVTLVERAERFLPREDEDIAQEVRNILADDGIEIVTGADAQRVSRIDGGRIRLTVTTPNGDGFIDGSHLLVAVGRTPNTDALDPAAAGIEVDKHGYILTNERLETNVPGIYALGDVRGEAAFTHISYDDFRVLRTNLIEDGDATIRGRLVPYTVFVDPQLAHVGLHESDAREQGYDIRVARLPVSSVARAIETGETRGVMKAVVDADTEQILGSTILAVNGGEVMSMIEIAMMGGLPYTALRDGVFAHPLLAESLNNLFASFE